MKQASMANEAGFKCQRSRLRWASKQASFFRAKKPQILFIIIEPWLHQYYIRRYP